MRVIMVIASVLILFGATCRTYGKESKDCPCTKVDPYTGDCSDDPGDFEPDGTPCTTADGKEGCCKDGDCLTDCYAFEEHHCPCEGTDGCPPCEGKALGPSCGNKVDCDSVYYSAYVSCKGWVSYRGQPKAYKRTVPCDYEINYKQLSACGLAAIGCGYTCTGCWLEPSKLSCLACLICIVGFGISGCNACDMITDEGCMPDLDAEPEIAYIWTHIPVGAQCP